MNKHMIFLLAIMMVLSMFSPYMLPGDSLEIFPDRGNHYTGFSIESYRQINGWTPVVLFSGDLELALRMNKAGQVFEWISEDYSKIQPLFTIDFRCEEIRLGQRHFPFLIYEQNPVRTRIRFLHEDEPVTLGINRQQNQVKFYLNGSRLPLNLLGAKFTPIAYGRYELRFIGPVVLTDPVFICETDTGKIYPRQDRERAPGQGEDQ